MNETFSTKDFKELNNPLLRKHIEKLKQKYTFLLDESKEIEIKLEESLKKIEEKNNQIKGKDEEIVYINILMK